MMRRSRTTMSFLSMEKSREPLDLGPCVVASSTSAVKRRFSGTPLLPPLAGRHVATTDLSQEPEHGRVVFTIEEDTSEGAKDHHVASFEVGPLRSEMTNNPLFTAVVDAGGVLQMSGVERNNLAGGLSKDY
ncbi:cAMP-specific 3',5'-cyclic phosphodiesterase 4C-like [Heteronotia binoei]|uniref:cAMP-specific 3',5'-cyclic phosphodiesterase 4C-like n=1 Tax=Heteronotia binoei TaxID=13085 RepID=UPI00292FB1C2|nr:cAMP-specific 3',5'-cyclic phosphodiesterase 4C-like [Heteronotia binoei]